jgi:high-affinity iron transporter
MSVSRSLDRRVLWVVLGVVALALLAWQMATGSGGTVDPTDAHGLSDTAVITDSAILVLREGLECILVLAAVTAGFLGVDRVLRRWVGLGASAALVASLVTWFVVVALLNDLAGTSQKAALAVQAATGLVAVVVLLAVMNWFFHNVYWTGWISSHHRRRRTLLATAREDGTVSRRVLWGLALLGFTCVYREGFEVVLFLQTLRLGYGSAIVVQGAALGLALTLAVGLVTFAFQHKLPYKRMLIATGVLLGIVLIVMVGEEVQEMQLAGWLPVTPLNVPLPGWVGLWFAVFPDVESLVAQVLAAAVVLGCYYLAVERSGRRRRAAAISAAPESA